MATSVLGRLRSKIRRTARISFDRTLLYRRVVDDGPHPRAAVCNGLEISLLSASELDELTSLGPVDVDEIGHRIDRGDRCYGARLAGELVHYSWVQHLGSHAIESAGLDIPIPDRELWIYNCRTSERHRGRGIYPQTLDHIVMDAFAAGANCAWIYAAESNVPSQRGIARAGFTFVATLRAVRFGPYVRALDDCDALRAA